mmetsp:Transcript_72447/g.223888  ORF Transcript_72447/g.223888 Transcript_72447/m.223888 type:complete len:279 (-) Transcript_72447:7-843(-)
MLDSALTTSMLMPHVATFLGIGSPGGGAASEERQFMAAGGAQQSTLALLEGLRLMGTDLDLGPISPIVTDFPQFSIGLGLGCPVDGMLGMEFYERFAVETADGRLRLHEAESAEDYAASQGMAQLTMAPLPARLLGISVELAGGGAAAPGVRQPGRVVGIVDTGASHSILNWAAASLLLGLRRGDPSLEAGGSISAYDVSGQPIDMPLVTAALALRGAGPEPCGLVSFGAVEVALGDMALFARLLGGDATVPAVLVGQDLLTQRPTLLAARSRLLCFG